MKAPEPQHLEEYLINYVNLPVWVVLPAILFSCPEIRHASARNALWRVDLATPLTASGDTLALNHTSYYLVKGNAPALS